jgi:myo-inositol-1(or 4)-monophosphatase
MNKNLTSYERVGMRALLAAERVLLKRFGIAKPDAYGYKAHREIVTAADSVANRAILTVLKKGTPGFDILSEEGSPRTRSDWRWIVDPLDGTTNYTAHLPLWGVSIALEHMGKVVLGLISLPAMNKRFLAVLHGGAWSLDKRGRRRIKVSATRRLDESLGLLCFGYRRNEKVRAMKIEPALAYGSRSVRRLGSAVEEASWVASGLADYSILIGVKPWDVAAGALLVREAGGRVLTPKGAEWHIDDSDIVFVTPRIAKQVLKISKRI